MNSTDLTQLLQKGFYITLGATASLLEAIQDPIKREESLTSLRRDLDKLTEELAEKGATTEVEARNLVDTLIARQMGTSETTNSPATDMTTVNTTATPVTEPNSEPQVRADLQELTQQLADLRAELEKLRQKDHS